MRPNKWIYVFHIFPRKKLGKLFAHKIIVSCVHVLELYFQIMFTYSRLFFATSNWLLYTAEKNISRSHRISILYHVNPLLDGIAYFTGWLYYPAILNQWLCGRLQCGTAVLSNVSKVTLIIPSPERDRMSQASSLSELFERKR